MNSKHLILLSTIGILLITFVHGQTNGPDISNIRKIYQKINTDKELKKITLEDEELVDEVLDGGVSLTGYFKDTTLVKALLWAGLSYGVLEIEYYFDYNNLVFAYVSENHFLQKNDTLDHSKLESKFEGRYYYNNNKLIHKITKGSGFWIQNNDSEESLLTDSNNYRKYLYSKTK